LAARIDSLRGVRVNFTATNGLTGANERIRTITRLVALPNAGLANRKSCGDEPIPPTGFVGANAILAGGKKAVRLTWNASVDEGGGEKDVIRYVVWRRQFASPNWGDPFESIPAGLPNYTWVDELVTPGETYAYAVASQDCTPTLSQIVTVGPITVP
jgi:hypothetical protein